MQGQLSDTRTLPAWIYKPCPANGSEAFITRKRKGQIVCPFNHDLNGAHTVHAGCEHVPIA
jgi:hypothetical protein